MDAGTLVRAGYYDLRKGAGELARIYAANLGLGDAIDGFNMSVAIEEKLCRIFRVAIGL
jgi:hypothetical protein